MKISRQIVEDIILGKPAKYAIADAIMSTGLFEMASKRSELLSKVEERVDTVREHCLKIYLMPNSGHAAHWNEEIECRLLEMSYYLEKMKSKASLKELENIFNVSSSLQSTAKEAKRLSIKYGRSLDFSSDNIYKFSLLWITFASKCTKWLIKGDEIEIPRFSLFE